MVSSPILRRMPTGHRFNVAAPQTVERKRSPEGTTIVSPASSNTNTPPTIGRITPTRRMLFERKAYRDSSVSKQSLADSVESRQEVEIEDLRLSNQRKESQLRVLHQRFQNIQQGLGSIDQERNSLVEKAKNLEKEKKHIQKQLQLREREIHALVKRCASQEEKMKESSRLRAQNKELTQALESVQNQINDSDQEREDLKSLRHKLQESELAREELQDRLRKVQREHDSIADTLQQCLANIRKLTEEKEQIEDDRRRERKLSEIEMEKQRIDHARQASGWKEDLENKQLKIDQMERILQENMFTKTALRREKAIKQEEIQEAIAKYEMKITELQEELDRKSDYMDEDYEAKVLFLQRKIEEKDALMVVLENEFSGQMGELMRKQSSLDEAEEEKRNLESKVEQLEKLECEYSALQDYVRILDSNLVDLTSENAYLTLDKDNLEEETQQLQQRMKELEFQLSRHYQHHGETEGDFCQLLEKEKDNVRKELEGALSQARDEVALLQSELASQGRWISKLEVQLDEDRREILEKVEEIRHLQQEKEESSDKLQFLLANARKEVAQLEAELDCRDHQLKMVKDTLENERVAYLQQVELLKEMEGSVQHSSAAKALNVQDGREPPPADDTVARDIERLELEQRVEKAENLVESLEKQISGCTDDLEMEKRSKQEIERKKVELESSLQKAHIDLQLCHEQNESMKKIHIHLEAEIEAIRLSSIRSDEESLKNAVNSKSLEAELLNACAGLKEKEAMIERLEKNFATLHEEKHSLIKSLDEANETIESLRNKLANTEDTHKDQLEAAQAALSEQERKIQKMQEQYNAAVDTQSRGEVYNREASSKIAVLENRIIDLQEKQSELKDELQDGAKAIASKDRQIQSFSLEKEEWEKKSITLQNQLYDERTMRTDLEQELAKKNDLNTLLRFELDDTGKTISMHQKRIEEMGNTISENEKIRLELESQLSDNMARSRSLEEEITFLGTKSSSLDKQLQAALEDTSRKEGFVRDTELILAEKSLEFSNMKKELEGEKKSRLDAQEKLRACEFCLASLEKEAATHKEKTAALEKDIVRANKELSKFEGEKKALHDRIEAIQNEMVQQEKFSDAQYHLLESKRSEACHMLEEKHKLIESLKESIRRGSEERETTRLKLSYCKDTMEMLEQELSKRDLRIKHLEEEVENRSKNEIEFAFVESEGKRVELERQLRESQAKIDQLTRNFEERGSALEELDLQLAQNSKEKSLQQQRADETSERCSELENRIKDLDEKIESREEQLISLSHDFGVAKQTISEKDQEARILKDVITSLKCMLEDSTKNAKAAQEEFEFRLNEGRERNVQTCAKLASVEVTLVEERDRAARYQEIISQQEAKLASLQTELNERSESKDKEFGEKEAALRAEIRKLETSVALKDDEIQELRVIELKDKEEVISSLSDALESLKIQMEAKNGELITTLNSLQGENKKLRDRVEHQDSDAKVEREKYTEHISKMERRIHDLETSKHKVEEHIAEQEAKLRERHSIITMLTQREAKLEQKEQVLLASCEQLAKSELSAKDEIERMKNALDVSIMRGKEGLEMQRQQLEAKYRKEVADYCSKQRTAELKLVETNSTLNERSSLLSEMVEHNKDLESKLDKQHAQISAIEEEMSRCRTDLSETQTELRRAREELYTRENALTAKLNEERIHRDVAERALSKLKLQVVDAARAKKMVSDLEKDNQALKDKVTRQEAYLQRKLQKEKIQRGRVAPVGSGAHTPNGKNNTSNYGWVCQTSPKPSKIPHTSHDNSQRSFRSISSAVPRSGIPSLKTTRSSDTDGNMSMRSKNDSWDLDVE